MNRKNYFKWKQIAEKHYSIEFRNKNFVQLGYTVKHTKTHAVRNNNAPDNIIILTVACSRSMLHNVNYNIIRNNKLY